MIRLNHLIKTEKYKIHVSWYFSLFFICQLFQLAHFPEHGNLTFEHSVYDEIMCLTYLSVVRCFENDSWQYFNSVNVVELPRSFIESRLSLMFTFLMWLRNWLISNMVRFAWIWYLIDFDVFGPTPASSMIWT